MKDFLLLTACVNPNGMSFTVLNNPNERKNQYIHALTWYLHNTDIAIIFCENSNTDLSTCFQSYINSGRLEILTFNGNNYNRSLGKGYGEAIIIEYSLRNSKMLSSMTDDERKSSRILKITGRLVCNNICNLAKKYKRPDCVYSDLENDDWGRVLCLSTVVFAPLKFWSDYFLPNKSWLNDTLHHYFEHLLWKEIKYWKQDGYKHREFLVSPSIIGVSGTSGVRIDKPTLKDKVIHLWMYFLHRYFHYYGYLNPLYKGIKDSVI